MELLNVAEQRTSLIVPRCAPSAAVCCWDVRPSAAAQLVGERSGPQQQLAAAGPTLQQASNPGPSPRAVPFASPTSRYRSVLLSVGRPAVAVPNEATGERCCSALLRSAQQPAPRCTELSAHSLHRSPQLPLCAAMSSYNPYLGEEPPADAYASMDVEDEYQGGQWVDGEFYYEKKRDQPRRPQSKAEATYGVWAEEEDEEEENERRAARHNKRRDEELISDDEQPQEEAVEEMEAAGRRGLGLGAVASHRTDTRYGRRHASSEGSSLLGRTVKFVSSSSPPVQPPTDEQPSPQPSAHPPSSSSADSSSAAPTSVSESTPTTTLSFKRRRLAQQAAINRQKQPDPAPSTATPTPPPPSRPFRPPTVDAEYAAFTQHSSPAVLQMMERMGFRGRLGKHETGVALPILPQVRPKGVGLGGVKEKVQRVGRNAQEEEKIEQEKEKEAERKKKEKADRRGTASVAGGGGAREKAWKRGERKGKTVYKTAHEVIQEHSQHPNTASASTATPTVIIDMTSGIPVQKQLSSLSSASSATEKPAASQPSACPELVHNVQLLCDLCENDILDTEKQLERLTLDTRDMEQEHARLTVTARKGREAEERLAAVIEAVAEVAKRLEESAGESVAVRLAVVEQFHRRLQQQWMREWRMYGLVRVVVVLLVPLLRELAGRWEVLPMKAEDADTGAELFAEVQRWRGLLDDSTSAVYYDELVNTLLLPPLRLALSTASLSLQQPSPIVSLFQQLHSVLPARLYSSVVSTLLLPRLQRLLGAYNPRSMAAPYWLLSYATVLSLEEVQSLAGVVRQRLMLTIGGWNVVDEVERKEATHHVEEDEVEEVRGAAEESMVKRVAGWKGVWKEDEMDAFLSRYIQPRLLAAVTGLRSSDSSTPLSSLPLVSAVLAWSPLFSPLAFTPILSASLSHFLSTLYNLLSQRDADFELASDVYERWKAVLTAATSGPHRTLVDEVSRRALAMMNAAMEDSDISSVYRDAIQLLKPTKPSTTTTAVPERSAEARPRPAAVAADRDGRSMRDVLYAFGAQHGFDVYPHGRRSMSGHEVYWFGGVQVYWSGEDVYAMDERSKEWGLVSLPELLQSAKQAQAGGRT